MQTAPKKVPPEAILCVDFFLRCFLSLMLFFAAFTHNYLTSLYCSGLTNFFFFWCFLWACLSSSHFLSWSRGIHFYFVIRLLKSLPQSLSGEQDFNKKKTFCGLLDCLSFVAHCLGDGEKMETIVERAFGPGNERTYPSREIKYTFNRPPASLPPWGQTGKQSVRLPSHTPLLAVLLPPRDHLCAGR